MKRTIYSTFLCVIPFILTFGQELSPSCICSGSHDYQDENMSWYGTLGGVFTESISNSNCFLTQGFQQGSTSVMGNEEFILPPDITIYPNPVETKFIMNQTQIHAGISQSIQVYDINGNLKFSRKGDCHQNPTDVSFLPAGIYILKYFQGDDPPLTIKFIKI